ncbi:MAG: chemotaxis protein CheB [Pseudomonadales bacterium]|nr:chemotaxis protein CheB [Pseudomonadales bacterium]
MVKFERPRIGIISDSPLQRHLLQHLLEAYGVEVLFNLDPERYQKPLAPIATDFDILLIEVENEDHCADFIDEILENTETPVLFGLGKAPERQSKEYPRWERRLYAKLREHLGDLEHVSDIGQALEELDQQDTESSPERLITSAKRSTQSETVDRVWILGASLGGPEAVKVFLDLLPEQLPVAFVYAQHIDSNFSEVLAKVLARHSCFKLKLAEEGERLRYGEILLTPVDREMYFDDSGLVRFKTTPWPGPYGPSIDQVLLNVANYYGDKCHAIFFSGMGNDGAIAAPLLSAYGSTIWVQESNSCANSSMPDSVAATGCTVFSGDPAQLAQELIKKIEKEVS